MKENKLVPEQAQSAPMTKRSKKRYEKPAVIHSQSLEAMAALCQPAPPGKSPSTVPACGTTFS